ncbi:GL16229 [Drosophila persimilis]|uniref:GL16229 n=1 Tax=Drosophila persimilis TaxID=7234 RepID=B4GQK7_DROPE|nr:GL16229 [Drosophila persimilis]
METETKASSEEQAKTATPVAMDTLDPPPPSSSKTLKRCLSVPIIRTPSGRPSPHAPMTTRAAAAAAAAAKEHEQTPKKNPPQHQQMEHYSSKCNSTIDYFGKSMHIRSQPNSREVSPAPVFNIFAPRARRYSASYSPMSTANGGTNGAALCLTPRVSQLRQEECADLNSREVNHEREVHREIQISQSWEDLTLVAENWSCKSDELSNPLQVTLPPTGSTSCSSPTGGQNNNSSSSDCPSPSSASPGAGGSSGPGMDAGSSSEPMCLALSGSSQSQSIDEGISIPESEPNSCRSRTSSILSTASSSTQVLVNDLADDATLMDDAKSETSSIGGCSTISIESSSCDSGAKTAATFLNRLVVDDGNSPLAQKSFYINKQGLSGAKKYIVNHHEGGGGPSKDVQQKL